MNCGSYFLPQCLITLHMSTIIGCGSANFGVDIFVTKLHSLHIV